LRFGAEKSDKNFKKIAQKIWWVKEKAVILQRQKGKEIP